MSLTRDQLESAREHGLPAYFDMQAHIGHTKHVGGWDSTQEIAGMMSLEAGQDLLYIGSGSGLAAIKVAQTYGCKVVGVDVLEGMILAAVEWAEKKGAGDIVEFRVADAQALPFEDDSFDVLLCESVNTFIPDLQRAGREYVRVVKPGSFVGLNEAVWYRAPPEKGAQVMLELTGQQLRRPHEWIDMLEQAGLEDIQDRTYRTEMRKEMRSQMGFLTLGEYLRIMGRAVKSLFGNEDIRKLMRLALREPRSYFKYMGYGLYVGRVPTCSDNCLNSHDND